MTEIAGLPKVAWGRVDEMNRRIEEAGVALEVLKAERARLVASEAVGWRRRDGLRFWVRRLFYGAIALWALAAAAGAEDAPKPPPTVAERAAQVEIGMLRQDAQQYMDVLAHASVTIQDLKARVVDVEAKLAERDKEVVALTKERDALKAKAAVAAPKGAMSVPVKPAQKSPGP